MSDGLASSPEPDLYTSPLGTSFPAPSTEAASWLAQAIELVAAVRDPDTALTDATLERLAPEAFDVMTGLAIVASRLLHELGEEAEDYLADLALDVARRRAM
jgi:hypothetical protein